MPRADGVEAAVITQPQAGRIFISYPRTDAQHIAGHLFDRLEARFGSGNVFMDVDSIEPGLDHGEAIDKAVGSRDVRALGDYQQARAIHEDTLARRQRVLGEDHPSTLITAQSLALTWKPWVHTNRPARWPRTSWSAASASATTVSHAYQ
jgi:tetratricopeptide repeat protein